MTILETSPEAVGLRERKKQQTRSTIHETAFRLIDEQGLDATTVDQICHEADVSSRTFFNYFPSKAAAALRFQGASIDPDVEEAFLSARGSLVLALCDVIGGSAERGPNVTRVKQLLAHRPELLTTATQMMVEAREMFIDLAVQRAKDREQAELAVGLVLAAFNMTLRDGSNSDAPIAEQLKATVHRLLAVGDAELT
ncbi:TetR family transcriptional regulator [Diaminobutyricibacter tongyongensis]|uniref:TetR family transcriptional regulator n=1 Tax=Leifsonia tongyongensis TaxID=1268043 RepID=A0A6L9XVB7_9MICO|nr:TetR family transcriptional regulator [Diaminobutyricibacter tongyongensis]NEN05381.1 TetR family transcriptional regulator [Diaminobutyricibacter tongyongensis]